uniref:V-type proton ATPase subunit G n=1 Tax=Oryctolagus cuniculus TaxID=9986 RepID=G1U826_RABIT
MASQSQGIQQLLQAEKRAAEKVSEARKRKNRRLKQAKEEAQAEIEQYRLQREKEFKAKEAAALGSHGSCSSEVEKETQEKMTILQTYFQQFGRAFPQPRGASSWVVVSQFFCDCVFLPRCGSPAGRPELGLQVLFWVLQLQRCRTRASRLPGVKMLPAPPLQ